MAGVLGHSEAGSSEAMIEIKIKTMDSQTYTLQVDKQMPVPALKERIASVTGVVMEHQRLICRGKVLKDDQLLSAYHVEDGHTLHLVVREPTVSLSQSLPADSANDQSSSGSRGQLFQIAPGIVVETFNLPRQGDRGLTDVSRIVSAVLGSIGITSIGNGSETREQVGDRRGGTPVPVGPADTAQTPPEQSGLRSQSSMSSLLSSFGIPSSASFGSVQPPVIPDSLATLSQYLSHMRQEFLNSGRTSENSEGASSFPGNAAVSSSPTQSESALPSLASLAELLSATRQMLNQQTDECLLQLASQLENHENITDSVARANAQTDAVRTGILLQNLGAYFLELGRTVTTLRLGRSSSEAIVNAGPAVFVSPSGPNPLMVQPLPFQPGASFGTPISGTPPSGSSLINGLGASSVPRRIDIQIRRGSSTHQTDPVGSRQSSGQTHTSGTVSGVRQNNQHATGTSDAPSLNSGAGAHVLPFRTVMAAFPDLSRAPQESSSGSLGFLFPFLGRLANLASGNLSSRTESQVPSEHQSGGMLAPESTNTQQNVEDRVENGRSPAASSGERESVSSRTIDINILSAGGMPNDENSEGQIPPSILQFLGGLFPGGEIHVESVSSQETETGLTEQARTNNTVPQEEPMATEEGLFLSRMLQQIMPLISQDSGTQQNVEQTREDSSQGRGDYTSSASAEDSEVGTSRQRGDLDTESPDPKRQKIE